MDNETLIEFDNFVEHTKSEPPRSAIILFAAQIDYILFATLTKFLLQKIDKEDELLQNDSAVSAFSARIKLCHRLGILDRQIYDALNALRKIRNKFAHDISASLEQSSLKDISKNIIHQAVKSQLFAQVKLTYYNDFTDKHTDLYASLTLICLILMATKEKISTIENTHTAKFL